MDSQARTKSPKSPKPSPDARGVVPSYSPQQQREQRSPTPQSYESERPPSPSGIPKYGGLVQTSADAYRQKKLENRVCGGAPYKGYSSFFSYLVGFGWLMPSEESGPQAAMRIRRSMSSRITFDSKNPPPDDY